MGRSGASSCLKLITCGGDSSDKGDDLHLPPSPPESKGSSDKRGWSFRKRSARHRVLSNIVVSENIAPASKEILEPVVEPNVQKTDSSAAAEKVSIVECIEEKPRLSVPAEPKVPKSVVVVDEDESGVDSQPDEYVVIVIQAAVRGFLARRELQKLKNVVKLQAAVRGHMVRQHASGTLRCVQAIIKMQALVRARHARLSNEKSSAVDESLGKPGKSSQKFLDKDSTEPVYVSIEKLLSNKFARQLIESTPKDKPISIKCDSSKPNSAWNWLERWMSVSSAEPTPKPESASEELAKVEAVVPKVEASVSAAEICEPAALETGPKEIVLAFETEESLMTKEAENIKSEAITPTPSVGGLSEERETPITKTYVSQEEREAPITGNSVIQEELSEVNSEIMSGSALLNPKPEVEQPDQEKRPMKRAASDELETEGKKLVFGSRKASNRSFIAAQSKFEEISSASSLNRSSSQDVEVERNMHTISSGHATETGTMDVNITETAVSHNLVHQHGGSECETELSVTSTLDSPDRLDADVVDAKHGAKIAEEDTYNDNSNTDADAETKNATSIVVEASSPSAVKEPEQILVSQGKPLNLTVTAESPWEEVKPESSASDVRATEVETQAAYRHSPEASPRSHVTVPESQGTPSSQVSVKAKRNSSDRSRSNHKRKSLSADKRSPSHQSHDTGIRSSVEQLHKEEQNGKRRSSFGSPRPDQRDEDPRDSNSSGSIPRFMQATKSARAKMNPSNSPRSSPDVQDREYTKKRHSLPGANGPHGSPHIQRSLSQAQPGAKGNGANVAHEKKWQR